MPATGKPTTSLESLSTDAIEATAPLCGTMAAIADPDRNTPLIILQDVAPGMNDTISHPSQPLTFEQQEERLNNEHRRTMDMADLELRRAAQDLEALKAREAVRLEALRIDDARVRDLTNAQQLVLKLIPRLALLIGVLLGATGGWSQLVTHCQNLMALLGSL